MKLTLRQKAAVLWCTSVVAGSLSLSGLTLLLATDDPEALLRAVQTYRAIHREYFRSVSDTELLNGAAEGMVASLGDPYSQLLRDDAYDSLMEQTSGEYGGIGVVIGADIHGDFYILSVFPGSAAETAGLRPGDQVLAIDGADAAGMDLTTAAEAIRGVSGTEVALSVLREGTALPFTVTRSNVTLPTVQSDLLEDGIGYIHIYTFASHTPEEFRKQYEDLTRKGMEKLVLDLRMNPGGLIDSVVAVADQILSEGPVVSYQEKGGAEQKYTVKGTENPLPLVVLIDGRSASASEILAGAVQDRKAGIVMGERSFGKGTVQVIHPMENREALKLSVAQYLTAAGRKIDQIGIQPDIAVLQTGRIFDPSTDNVLQTAVETLRTMNQ